MISENTTCYTYMSDRQLVTEIKKGDQEEQIKEMMQVLYLRYMNFIHKHWHALSRQLNGSQLVQDVKDDFYSESYLSFTRALDAVDLAKIQNDNWKFLGYFGFYLSNQRNTFAKRLIQKYQEETAIELPEAFGENKTIYLSDISEKGTVSSAEDTFLQDDHRRRFWSGLDYCKTKLWTDIEVKIFNMREKGESIKTICNEVSISPWRYSKILTTMKNQLEKAVEES